MQLRAVLVQYRPIKELKETLLHEMIHALLFLERIKDDGDHGSVFKRYMTQINTSQVADCMVGTSFHGWHVDK